MSVATRLLALRIERLAVLARARAGIADPDAQRLLAANTAARDHEQRMADKATPALALAARFALSPFELDVLHLAVGAQLEPGLRAIVGPLTVGRALCVLASTIDARIELAQVLRTSRLWSAGLLRRDARDDLDTALVPTRRARAALLGRDLLDDLPVGATLRTATQGPQLEIDAARAAVVLATPRPGIAVVSGGPGTGKTTVARAIASRLGDRYLELTGSVDAELVEDAGLTGTPVVIDGDAPSLDVITAVDRAEVPAVICVREASLELVDRARLRIQLRGLRGEPLATAWPQAGLPPDLTMTPRQISHAAILVERLDVTPEVAVQHVRHGACDLLETTRPALRLQDIVLADDTRAELVELIGAIRARHEVLATWGMAARLTRGTGISALFDGAPGTGKTMAADVVSSEVGIALHRVNVATLVDKYVGETEKNLTRAFAEARIAGHILLFDEADALFGARGDGKGANDRYANLEVNVLLQLMEEHPGITILTTNLKRNIDPAFMRRISYKVRFEVPDEELRFGIWDALIPSERRAPDLDLWELARAFPLAGGDIKSAVMRASYRAAANGRPLDLADLAECAQLECHAMGRVVAWGEERS